MPIGSLIQHAEEALMLIAVLSLPVVAVAALIGLVVAAFQAASQIQDPTLSHLPRLLGVIAVLAISGPWMAHEVAVYAERVFIAAH